MNPFAEEYDSEDSDIDLIAGSLEGNIDSLERLILRHQAWIYNIAFRMILDPVEAEDVTQEILIKVITKLGSFDTSKASFRTWLYRIVTNHILNLEKSKRTYTVTEMTGGGAYLNILEEIKDTGLAASPERYAIFSETRAWCLSGMLICLKPRERLVFILSALFDVTDTLGSEILSITPSNFRKILSRGRKKLNNFFSNNCSLIDESNPCKCSYHAEYIEKLGLKPEAAQEGAASPLNLKKNGELNKKINEIETYYRRDFIDLYKSQPMVSAPDLSSWIHKIISTKDFKDLFNLH